MEELSEFKKSLKGVKALLDAAGGTLRKVPDFYIAPPSVRIAVLENPGADIQIPAIDLADLHTSQRARVLQAIADACKDWGFFQIVNHGVPTSVLDAMMQATQQFFELPFEDKESLYCNDPYRAVRFGTSVSLAQEKSFLHWRDYLAHPLFPALPEILPTKPLQYREVALQYSEHITAISEGLGLESDYVTKTFGDFTLNLLSNYYPASPNPDLTVGGMAHCDSGGITVLHQNDVSALQVKRNGKWVPINPIPQGLIINLGDQLQILTNGKYKSVEHQVASTKQCRISIATFLKPSCNSKIAPIPCLVDDKPIYKVVLYGDYQKNFIRRRAINHNTCLDSYKVEDICREF